MMKRFYRIILAAFAAAVFTLVAAGAEASWRIVARTDNDVVKILTEAGARVPDDVLSYKLAKDIVLSHGPNLDVNWLE